MVSAEVPVFFLRFSLGRGEEKMKEKDTTIGQVPIRDARTLGAPRMLVLGLQQMCIRDRAGPDGPGHPSA